MKSGLNKILGLAVGERSILVAEISNSDGRRQISRAGEFVYAAGVSFQNPQALGAALGTYLKAEGFSAKAVVFGIPAKWVLTKSKEVPPVDPSLAADMLRLQVESEFSAELKDLVYDYAGQTNPSVASHILLAATPRRHVDQLMALAEAAKLEVRAITPTAVVLSAATGGMSDALVLSITPSGTELAAQRGANPSLLRHVGSSLAVTASVAGEVRRASLMMPRNGATGGNGSANGHAHGQVVVWDDAGLDPAARQAVTDALGPYARSGDLTTLGAGDVPQGVNAGAAAIALAVAGLTAGAIPVDFHHSRLAEPKKSALPRPAVLGIAGGVLILLCFIGGYIDLSRREADRDQLKGDVQKLQLSVNGMPSPVDAAKADIARNKFALGWHSSRPRYLACLADLTNAAPEVSRPDIFLVTLTLEDSMKGEIRGRAKTAKAAKAYIDALNKSPHFANVTGGHETGNSNPDTKVDFPITFSIVFTYRPG